MDLAVAVWCMLWAWMGLQVANDIRGLIHLSDTVSRVGLAIQETGRTIESLQDLPVVGSELSAPGRQISEAGRSAVESARESRRSVQRTGTLLGLSIALIPTMPLLMLYLPRRFGRAGP